MSLWRVNIDGSLSDRHRSGNGHGRYATARIWQLRSPGHNVILNGRDRQHVHGLAQLL